MAGERANVRTVTQMLPALAVAEDACRELGWTEAVEHCIELRRHLASWVLMTTNDSGEDFQRAQEAFHGYNRRF